MVPRTRPQPRTIWWVCVRLAHRHKHPLFALIRLFIPLPTWHFRAPEPVPPRVMLNNGPLLVSRTTTDLPNMRSIPIWRAREIPLFDPYTGFTRPWSRASPLPLVQRWSISGTRIDGHGNSIASQTPAMRIRFGMPFWPVSLKSLQMHSTGD